MNELPNKSNYKYLEYLAKTGAKDIHPKKEAATSFLIQRLAIKERQKILEVGFGTGETLLRIASHYDVVLYGIDSMPEMFRQAEKKLKSAGLDERINLSLIQKGSHFPYNDNNFDIIYAESVLGFQDNPDLFHMIKEIFRVLKPSGRLGINDSFWRKDLNNDTIRKINTGCLKDFGMRQASDEYWTIDDWIKLYEKYGFRLKSSDLIENMNGSPSPSLPEGEKVRKNYFGKWEKVFTNPFLIKDRIGYRQKLRAHKQDGQYIEPWILILEKEDYA